MKSVKTKLRINNFFESRIDTKVELRKISEKYHFLIDQWHCIYSLEICIKYNIFYYQWNWFKPTAHLRTISILTQNVCLSFQMYILKYYQCIPKRGRRSNSNPEMYSRFIQRRGGTILSLFFCQIIFNDAHLKEQTHILSQNWNWFKICSHGFIPERVMARQ
jgi:hypothetical protein